MSENRNMVLAIALSALVLFGWQYFVGLPKVEKEKEAERVQRTQQQAQQPSQTAPAGKTAPVPGTPQSGSAPAGTMTRAAALAASPRVAIETPRIKGSIALKGARIDDVRSSSYRETIDPKSPNIVLLSPAGGPNPYYAEFGWVARAGGTAQAARPRHGVDADGRTRSTPASR